MKTVLTLFISFMAITACSQTTNKYYDENWAETSSDKAVYYASFTPEGKNYRFTSYWVAGNKLRGTSLYPDTVMAKPIGRQVLYFKNGNVEDSVMYEQDRVTDHYHYFTNGKLSAHYHVQGNQTDGVVEGFEEDGRRIKNYIYQKEAEFKGGLKAWQQYVIKSVSKDLEIKAEGETEARVQIQFIVSGDGAITSANVFKSSGFPQVDKDALRVIKDSPEWKGAVLFNEPVNAYRLQPFVYQFINGKQKR